MDYCTLMYVQSASCSSYFVTHSLLPAVDHGTLTLIRVALIFAEAFFTSAKILFRY